MNQSESRSHIYSLTYLFVRSDPFLSGNSLRSFLLTPVILFYAMAMYICMYIVEVYVELFTVYVVLAKTKTRTKVIWSTLKLDVPITFKI